MSWRWKDRNMNARLAAIHVPNVANKTTIASFPKKYPIAMAVGPALARSPGLVVT